MLDRAKTTTPISSSAHFSEMEGPSSLASQLRDHADRHRQLADTIPQIMDRGVERTAREAFGGSQEYVPVDEGDLKRSGELRRLGTARFEIRYTEDYAVAVERGHSGYTVTPTDAEALRFEVDGVTVFAQKAEIPPRDGVWYLKRAVEEYRDDHPRNIGAEYRRVLDRIFR